MLSRSVSLGLSRAIRFLVSVGAKRVGARRIVTRHVEARAVEAKRVQAKRIEARRVDAMWFEGRGLEMIRISLGADLPRPLGVSISFLGSFVPLRLGELMLSTWPSAAPVFGQRRACSRGANVSSSQGRGRKMLRPPRGADLQRQLCISIRFLCSFAPLRLRELMLSRSRPVSGQRRAGLRPASGLQPRCNCF